MLKIKNFMKYYKILEINKNAKKKEIKYVYRKLALRWHPDKNQNNIQSTEKFKEINEAYEILIEYIKEKEKKIQKKNIKKKHKTEFKKQQTKEKQKKKKEENIIKKKQEEIKKQAKE
ncbi:6643_t:CDS:1 [Cetraspora pellucida]|uniref:6643_t:CDS:1 n=1 Tax=Cetraspora pellucida TaxID=1433469 RepID=A0A9N9K7V2_9GLOM|nr:6643_t:CDS:1 [Cetraspora pellucida]